MTAYNTNCKLTVQHSARRVLKQKCITYRQLTSNAHTVSHAHRHVSIDRGAVDQIVSRVPPECTAQQTALLSAPRRVKILTCLSCNTQLSELPPVSTNTTCLLKEGHVST